MPRSELEANIAEADGLFCLLTDRIDEELLAKASEKLRVVSTMSVGTCGREILERDFG